MNPCASALHSEVRYAAREKDFADHRAKSKRLNNAERRKTLAFKAFCVVRRAIYNGICLFGTADGKRKSDKTAFVCRCDPYARYP